MQKPAFLPDHIQWHTDVAQDGLAYSLAQTIAQQLAQALVHQDTVSLALSGGNTPKAMLAYLSQMDLAWSQVEVTLVDERFVAPDQTGSNEAMIKAYLMQNKASSAHFIPLYYHADLATNMQQCETVLKRISQPLDIVTLGMGNDGHTASFFPNCSNLPAVMDMQLQSICMATRAPVEPKQRITWTARPLHLAKQRYLHLVGEDKLVILEEAMNLKSLYKMPIFAFLQRPLHIFWSPA